jgi:murein DD-endopeptidase MepM/ murein hydrolase activator NlpD
MGPFAVGALMSLALASLAGSAGTAAASERPRIGPDARATTVAELRSRWPVHGPITSAFGPRRAFARFHHGIDIAVEPATPCRTAAAGKVVHAGWRNGYGKTVIVDHGDGIQTLYGHLLSIGVRRGQRVARGALLGLTGATGHVSGPHLHYEILVNGRPVDPGPYLASAPGGHRASARAGMASVVRAGRVASAR